VLKCVAAHFQAGAKLGIGAAVWVRLRDAVRRRG